jgi:acyl-CoA thioester hydrolase
MPFVHEHPVRVRYVECDPMGVGHHTSHLVWFEEARIEYLRARGISYAELEKEGFSLPVVELRCRYHAPSRYDEVLLIRVWVDRIRRSSIRFRYEVRGRGEERLRSEGETLLACVDRSFRPTRLPAGVVGTLT